MLMRTAYAVANAMEIWLQILRSGDDSSWRLTTSTRNAEPRKSDGVSRITIPSGVLALSGPPREPSSPAHSASCPTTYVRLNTVASAADQKPMVLVEGEISLVITPPVCFTLDVSSEPRCAPAQESAVPPPALWAASRTRSR